MSDWEKFKKEHGIHDYTEIVVCEKSIQEYIRALLEEELCYICKRPKKGIGSQFCSYPHPLSRDLFNEEVDKVKSQCADELEEEMCMLRWAENYDMEDAKVCIEDHQKFIDNLIKKWKG